MALPGPKTGLHGGNLFETIISALVILIALGFLVFFYSRTGTGHLGSYSLRLKLPDAAGLSVGSEVRLAGTKIGSVTDLSLDPADYRAIVEIQIRDDLSLPIDTKAMVSSSPMGDVFLVLSPGHAAGSVPPNGELKAPLPAGRAGA